MQHRAYSEAANNVKNGKGGPDIGIVGEGFLEHVNLNATSINAPLCVTFWRELLAVHSWCAARGRKRQLLKN